jgi:hypothetical protein
MQPLPRIGECSNVYNIAPVFSSLHLCSPPLKLAIQNVISCITFLQWCMLHFILLNLLFAISSSDTSGSGLSAGWDVQIFVFEFVLRTQLSLGHRLVHLCSRHKLSWSFHIFPSKNTVHWPVALQASAANGDCYLLLSLFG